MTGNVQFGANLSGDSGGDKSGISESSSALRAPEHAHGHLDATPLQQFGPASVTLGARTPPLASRRS